MTPLAWDRTHIWHPYASLGNPPPVLLAKRASGVEIELDDGQRLVDAVSSWWCVAHGHNHPALVEAIRRQSERHGAVYARKCTFWRSKWRSRYLQGRCRRRRGKGRTL